MAVQTHISATVAITNHTVSKNGEVLFTSGAIDIQALLVDIYRHFELSYTRFYKMDNLSKLGWLAAEILLNDSLIKDKYQPEQVGLVLVNANSSLDSDLKYMASVADIASPALFVYTLPNIMAGEICIRNNFKGETAFFISDDFDAGFIGQYVNNLFNSDIFEACICGWVDVLADEHKAVLFLIEKGEGAIPFSTEYMYKVFNK